MTDVLEQLKALNNVPMACDMARAINAAIAEITYLRSVAGAPVDVEITPAMIDAGIEAFSRVDREFDSAEQIVASVFVAMVSARRERLCSIAGAVSDGPSMAEVKANLSDPRTTFVDAWISTVLRKDPA